VDLFTSWLSGKTKYSLYVIRCSTSGWNAITAATHAYSCRRSSIAKNGNRLKFLNNECGLLPDFLSVVQFAGNNPMFCEIILYQDDFQIIYFYSLLLFSLF
jgi:hypothetical protein